MVNLLTAIMGAVFLDEKDSSSDLWVVFIATAISTILEVPFSILLFSYPNIVF